jgi:hypothetical protein
MRLREWLTAGSLAAVLVVPVLAQTQTGVLRISVKVPGTLAPVPGVQIALSGPRALTLLDLPDNEADLLAYLEALAAARGIAASARTASANIQPIIVTRSGQTISAAPAPWCAGATAALERVVAPIAVTDADGIAVIPNLKPGNYAVRVGREGYLGVPWSPESVTPAPSVVSSEIEVSGTVATQIALYLNPAATVSGRITDANGAPVINACVMLGIRRQQNSGAEFLPGQGAMTDDKGNYQVQSVGLGKYAIRVRPAASSAILYYPGVADLEKATELSIEAGSNTVGIDLKLP